MSIKELSSFLFIILLFTQVSFADNYKINNVEEIAAQPSGVLNVITTLSIIEDWAYEIGKGLFTPVSIVSGLEDPHTYEVKPDDLTIIGEADLFIRFGLPGLESWVNDIIEAYPSLNVLTLANEDMMLTDPVTGDKNPHLWMSPIFAKNFVQNMTEEIIILNPTNENKYLSNRDNYLLDLDRLIDKIEGEYKEQLSGLKVVVHHPSFFYLLDLLEVERVGVIEEKEGSEPSAQHIQEITSLMIEQNIKTIIAQPQIEEELVLQMARDTGASIAKLTPLLGVNGLTTYIAMIEYDIYALQNPEEIESSQSTILALIISGSILVAVVIAVILYLRFRK